MLGKDKKLDQLMLTNPRDAMLDM